MRARVVTLTILQSQVQLLLTGEVQCNKNIITFTRKRVSSLVLKRVARAELRVECLI